jgi:diguanylate cyclase (GGDEF)-like protein/PAS domain S-box-containing protein
VPLTDRLGTSRLLLARTWQGILLTLLLAGLPLVSAVGVNHLNRQAAQDLDASLGTAQMQNVATNEVFLTWEAVAGEVSPAQLATLLGQDRTSMSAHMTALRQAQVDSDIIGNLDRRLTAYNSAVTVGVAQISTGAHVDLLAPQNLAVLESFLSLGQAVADAQQTLRGEATRAQAAQLWGSTILIMLTSLLLVGLLWASARRRRREAVARAEAETLRQSERSFRIIFEGSPQPMWVFVPESLEFLAVNDAAVVGYGHSRTEFLDLRVSDLLPEEDHLRFLQDIRDRNAGDTGSRMWRHILKGGRVIDVAVSADVVEFGGRSAMFVIAEDVTEQRAVDRQLEHRAFHDSLTGLPNRALFQDRVHHAILRSARSWRLCALVLLDLDDFRTVNDSLGHAAGDELLVEVAARLGLVVRPGDTLARLGGDEFAILVEDIVDGDAAQRIAERVVHGLREPFSLGGQPVAIAASVGIAVSQLAAECTPQTLMRDADVAMYAAKRRGTGSWALFGPEMHASVQRRLELRRALGHAITAGQLVVHYQPLVDIGTGAPTGAEALVRWQHPQLGLVSPDEFIPLAEETGQVVDIGRRVLGEAVRQIAEWNRLTGHGRLEMSVNVSTRQLVVDGFVGEVLDVLAEHRVSPRQLTLEITEATLVQEQQRTIHTLEALREQGVRIAVDDFGTGYSSLAYLRDLPIDEVKIDRSFVSGVADSIEARAMTLAVVRLVSMLNVRTVAEGIENLEQLAYMSAMGCERGQGYLYSPPVPAAEAIAYITAASAAAYAGRASPIAEGACREHEAPVSMGGGLAHRIG